MKNKYLIMVLIVLLLNLWLLYLVYLKFENNNNKLDNIAFEIQKPIECELNYNTK